MRRTVVLGGGLTGLVAAERLQAVGVPVLVLEREAEPGGACRSVVRDGFTFDYTAHLLHIKRAETRAYVEELGVYERLRRHDRLAAVWIGGHVTPYPIQINTHGLAPEVRRDCLLGFIRAWAEEPGGEPSCFEEWVYERFGEGLARHFFFPYNGKLYRARPDELDLDWVGRYVPRPGLEEVVDGALGLHRGPVGYNASFLYPEEGGIRMLPDAVASRVDELALGQEVVAVHPGEGWLELADGHRQGFDRLVSTLPLPCLLDMLVDGLPEEVRSARRALRWVRVLNLALGVRGPAQRREHWLYFPEPELPFYRVGLPSNHGRMAPEGCHTVSLEISLDPGGGGVEEVAVRAEQALADIGLVEPEKVMVRVTTVLDPAYVVHDLGRQRALATIREHLEHCGVAVAGRWAEWKYSAMEDAILDGMAVAARLRPGAGR